MFIKLEGNFSHQFKHQILQLRLTIQLFWEVNKYTRYRNRILDEHSQCVSRSTNQPVSRAFSQSVSQSVNQPVPVINQPLSQPVSPSVSQPVSQSNSHKQSVNQSVSHSVSHTVSRSVSQSVSRSVNQSNRQSFHQPVSQIQSYQFQTLTGYGNGITPTITCCSLNATETQRCLALISITTFPSETRYVNKQLQSALPVQSDGREKHPLVSPHPVLSIYQ